MNNGPAPIDREPPSTPAPPTITVRKMTPAEAAAFKRAWDDAEFFGNGFIHVTNDDLEQLAAANAKIAQLQSILRERDTMGA